MTKLPEKRQRFVDAYLDDGNATRAATVAGYAKPEAEAWRLLRDAGVAAAIAAAKEADAKIRISSREERLIWLDEVRRGEVTEEVVTKEGEVIAKAPGIRDRLKAADQMAKMLGEYARAELTQGPAVAMHVTGNVTVADMTEELRQRRLARLKAGGGSDDEEG